MKTITAMICFPVLILLAGCGMPTSVYNLAADERDTTVIVSDSYISTVIQKSILDEKDLNPLDLSAYCYEGHVYLVGECETEGQKARIIEKAKGTKGVKSVTPYILHRKAQDDCGTAESLAIKGKLRARLIADMDIWSTTVDFKVVQCRIVLLGIVESEDEITRAKAHARSVDGNRGVISYLKATESRSRK